MISVQYIRDEKEKVLSGLAKKHFGNKQIVDEILNLDEERRKLQFQLDNNLAESKNIARQIGEYMRNGDSKEAAKLKIRTPELKESAKKIEELLLVTEKKQFDLVVQLPNIPHSSVPIGKTPEENEIVKTWGIIPDLSEKALCHWDITAKYDIIDFELGNKISGAGFPVYKGQGARLQRGLINFFLDEAISAGYKEIQPPILVNEDSAFATGQLPDKEGQMYYIAQDNLYCIPTAEVPITNLYRDIIIQENELPVKNVGYTPCFRREAGSYGSNVRGLNRLHQFDKVEIVNISHPESSYQILEEMSEYVQSLLQKLCLPYRVLRLCGGDMSFASALTYDMEVYSAAQKRWLEVSSVSNFETFQSNRLKLRIKKEGKNIPAHTLNGSALALPRIVAAILENNQTEQGIKMPECLIPYLGFDIIK